MFTHLKMVRSSSRSLTVRLFALIIAFMLLGAFLPGCALFPTEEEVLAPPLVKPVEVEFDKFVVERKPFIKDKITGNGTFKYENSSTLFVTFPGSKLKEIYVNLDDAVTKGQLVGELENQSIIEYMHEVEARLIKAEIEMSLFELENKDISQSADKTGTEYEKYLLNKQISQINMDGIKDRLAQAQEEYEQTMLRSPLDGTVSFRTSRRDGERIPAFETIYQVFSMADGKVSTIFMSDDSRLKAAYIKAGEIVKNGDLLGELDNEALKNSIKEMTAELEKAQISMQISELAMDDLLQDGDDTDTNANYQRYLLTKQIKEIDIGLIRESLARIRAEYEQTLLTSPIDGIVNNKTDAEQGDSISAYEMILQIADPSELLLQWDLDSSVNTQLIHTGAMVGITISKKEYTGKVVATPADLARQKDREDLGRIVLIKVDDLPSDIEESVYAKINFVIKQSENVLVIPSNAIRTEGAKTFVNVLEGSLKRERVIELGIRTPAEVEVVNGLKEGEIIIIPD